MRSRGRSPSIRLSEAAIWFQLVKIRLTTYLLLPVRLSRSPDPRLHNVSTRGGARRLGSESSSAVALTPLNVFGPALNRAGWGQDQLFGALIPSYGFDDIERLGIRLFDDRDGDLPTSACDRLA